MNRLFNLAVVLLKHDGEKNGQHWLGIAGILSIILLGFTSHALAVDINEKLSIGGVIGGAYQYQSVNDTDAENAGRGGLSIQPEISYRPTDKNELFAKFGFAAGNGLNEISPFVLAPWAAPMEDDVKDINGRNRDYRLIIDGTSKEFLDIDGEDKERKVCVILSFDQQFGDIFGAWIRVGKQDDKASVDCENLLSGGINISGKLWGREDDNFGIGYAYINGGNTDLDSSQVAEAYVRFALDEYVALTLDVQYMQDRYDDADDPNGFIYGLRLAAEF